MYLLWFCVGYHYIEGTKVEPCLGYIFAFVYWVRTENTDTSKIPELVELDEKLTSALEIMFELIQVLNIDDYDQDLFQ